MKNLIKRIIPKRMMPFVHRVHWRLLEQKADFSQKKYEKLTALKCIVAYNKYGGYCIPKSSCHRPAAYRTLSNDVYEPKTIEFIVSHSGNGDIVHAGAYFGDFFPAISKGVAPNSKIWAFEPNPENYRCAKITLEINDISNVVLTNAGLGAKKESLLMQITDENGLALGGGSQVLEKKADKESGVESIQIVTIDDLIGSDRVVSIIQLDVEGYEKEALTGAIETIQRCHPIIIFEALPNSTLLGSNWFSENILNLGYCKINEFHGNLVFKCEN